MRDGRERKSCTDGVKSAELVKFPHKHSYSHTKARVVHEASLFPSTNASFDISEERNRDNLWKSRFAVADDPTARRVKKQRRNRRVAIAVATVFAILIVVVIVIVVYIVLNRK